MDQKLFENLCYMILDINSSSQLKALSPSTSHPSAIQYSSFVLSIVTCIIGFAANIIVIFATGFLMKKNKYKIWFLNLALADFMYLLFLPLHAVSVIRGRWPYETTVCKLYNYLRFVHMYAGIYILTALNIDRALSVAKPIWHLRFNSQRSTCSMCALIWIFAVTCIIPAIIYSDVDGKTEKELFNLSFSVFEGSAQSSINHSLEYNVIQIRPFSRELCRNFSDNFEMSVRMKYVTEWREELFRLMIYVLPLAVVGYGIPLCLILFSNIIIALHMKNSLLAASSRLYRVVAVEVMIFFCLRTPCVLAFIIYLVSMYTMQLTLRYKVSAFMQLLHSISATNSFLNPVVYVLVGKNVRSEIMQFFRKT